MRTILIAGRGEIAVRIARACRDAGLVSVAVYADPVDRVARHVRAADRAVPLAGQTPARTYLDPARMLRAAVASGADALHPGYGPLAEDADFAQAVLHLGLTWIGPSPAVIRRLVDDALADATRAWFPGAGSVVAVGYAGIPWAKTLAERLDLPLAYVRAGARAAGGPLVECAPSGDAPAIIVEDVVASGGSVARAIQPVRAETSLGIAGIGSIANWNFPEMRTRLAPWPVRALTSYPQVLASAQQAGMVSAAGARELLRFYADPRRHSWSLPR